MPATSLNFQACTSTQKLSNDGAAGSSLTKSQKTCIVEIYLTLVKKRSMAFYLNNCTLQKGKYQSLLTVFGYTLDLRWQQITQNTIVVLSQTGDRDIAIRRLGDTKITCLNPFQNKFTFFTGSPLVIFQVSNCTTDLPILGSCAE